ncbi:hypothetical protein Lal_00024128 [Lupinus albus]|nr:hypothetical protein Lal_00024128 [Lupinus albus]
MVHNTQDTMLHNSRIPPNHVRVTIDIEIEDNALLPIPLDVDIITLGGAICTFVAWPVHLVDVVPTKGMVIDEHSATTPTKVEHASKKTKVVKSKRKENKSRSKSSNKESSGERSIQVALLRKGENILKSGEREKVGAVGLRGSCVLLSLTMLDLLTCVIGHQRDAPDRDTQEGTFLLA